MVIRNRAVGDSAVGGRGSQQRGILGRRCLWSHYRDCIYRDRSRLSLSQNDLTELLRGKKQIEERKHLNPKNSPREDKRPLTLGPDLSLSLIHI